jgi:hypothetical protein
MAPSDAFQVDKSRRIAKVDVSIVSSICMPNQDFEGQMRQIPTKYRVQRIRENRLVAAPSTKLALSAYGKTIRYKRVYLFALHQALKDLTELVNLADRRCFHNHNATVI